MARAQRLLGPLAISAGAHGLVLLLSIYGPRVAWPAPPIPIEVVRPPHRTTQRQGPAERRGDPQQPPSTPKKIARGPGPHPTAPRPPPPPETTDLAPFAPDDAHVVVLLRMDKLRASPHRAGAEALLGALPDWTTLVAGSGVSPIDDFDALLIATANPRDVTATFLAARHADTPKVRALAGRTLPDGDPRIFRMLKPGLTILAPPQELDSDMGAAARGKWLEQLDTFDQVARAAGGPALLVTLSDVPSLVHLGAGLPTPQSIALATTVEASPSLRVRIVFANPDEARTFAAQWPQILARYRAMTGLLGLATALDGIAMSSHDDEVELAGRIAEAQLNLAIRWIVPLLPHAAPPPLDDSTRPQ
jgi:hypothetical protein